ncbi:MAG: hypothetical protein HUJ68_13710, partial [Clostridia bacterium]|nr:hypothetical protein [Clostridia bacterium]
DIERALISPTEILGYFSNYILESGNKIIFIGNEDEIKDNDVSLKECNEENIRLKEWRRIKEKVIGDEYTIMPDFDSALESFFIDFWNETDRKEKILPIIKKVAENLEVSNLRILRQLIMKLKEFYNSVIEFAKDDEIDLFINLYSVLYIEKVMGFIPINATNNKENNKSLDDKNRILLSEVAKQYLLTERRYDKDSDVSGNQAIMRVPLVNLWYSIIYLDFIDAKALSQAYEEEKKQDNTKIIETSEKYRRDPLFELVDNFKTMNEEIFKKALDDISDSIKKANNPINPGYILLVYNILYSFIQWKLIPNDNVYLSVLDSEINKNPWKVKPIEDWGEIEIGFAGYAFTPSQEFKMKVNQIKEIYSKNREDLLANEWNRYLENITETNIQELCNYITRLGTDYKYAEIPVLACVKNIEAFFKKIYTFSLQNQYKIEEAFEIRYGKKTSKDGLSAVYYSDYDNLKNLAVLYKGNTPDNFEYNPQKMMLSQLSNNYEALCNFFVNQMNNHGVIL